MDFQSGPHGSNWGNASRSPSKRARSVYQISESDTDFEHEDDTYGDRFQNPDAFLNQFGGYESENSEDPQEDEEIEYGNEGTFRS
jgi:hypothetical protein